MDDSNIFSQGLGKHECSEDFRIWELFYRPDHKKRRVNATWVMCRVCYLDVHKPTHEDQFTTDFLISHVQHCTGSAKQYAEVLKIPDLVYLYENKAFEGISKFHNLSDHLRKISQMDSFKRMSKQRLAMAMAEMNKSANDSDTTVIYKPE